MPTALKLDRKYTYADLLNWPEDERWELIDGVLYAMAAPNLKHQRVLGNLHRKFHEHLEDKTCEIFVAPCDVRLLADKNNGSDDKSDNTVVQPDLLVVCDPDKLADGKAVKGAPDLVIEILSPSNASHDMVKKFQKYRNANVPEIWFIDPDTGTTQVFLLENGKYSVDFYSAEDVVPVGILPGFELDMKMIF